MYDGHPHPLLAQVPLTVSPFLSLPTATTLPYTYKQLPSTLPPSSIDSSSSTTANGPTSTNTGPTTDPAPTSSKPAYVVSKGGHAAHPDDIIASCHALQKHLGELEQGSRAELEKWEAGIRERELAEKRRVAPGWLDTEDRMLQPVKKGDDSSGGDHNEVKGDEIRGNGIEDLL